MISIRFECLHSKLHIRTLYPLKNMLNRFMASQIYKTEIDSHEMNQDSLSCCHGENGPSICLRVYLVPHLDGLSDQPQREQLLNHHPLFSLCPQVREQREYLGKKILNGPGMPVCSPCYALKVTNNGNSMDKSKA